MIKTITPTAFLFTLLITFQPASFAEEAAIPDKDKQPSQYKAYIERVKARESKAPGVAYETVDKNNIPEREERWSDFLPILGKQARAEGYVIPLPFGISLVGLTQEQPFSVSRIGLAFDGTENATINNLIDESITAKNLTVEDTTFNLRFDAWIFPFWNIYGLAGKTEGTARLQLDADLDIPTPILIAAGIGSGLNSARCTSLNLPFNGPNPGSCNIGLTDIPVKLNFHGDVLGYGTTIAGGYGDFFGMFDVNYSEADVNISKEKSKQTVYSTRIGWSGSAGLWSGQIWVGGMKQDIEQTLNIELPGTNIAAVIDQKASSPYNYLIGGAWNISEQWQLVFESSFLFSDRSQFMAQVTRRF